MSRPPEPPRRPSLPATLPALAAVLVGEVVVLRLGWEPPWPALAFTAMGLTGVSVALRAYPVVRLGTIVGACALVGLAAGLVARWSLGQSAEALSSSSVSRWSFAVTGDPSLGDHGYRCRARASCPGLPSGDVWLTAEEEPALGETLACVGRFKPNGDDEWGASNRAQGIAGTVSVVRIVRREPAGGVRGLVMALRGRAVEAMGARDSETGALVAASVCGYRAGMDAFGLTDLFSACGVSHLVAVSGGHLAVVSGILSALLEGAGLRPRLRTPLLIVASGAFVVFCGAPVSAVRSWLMVVVALGAELAGRRGHALSAVCLVGCALALVDPFVSGQLGFLLSVASVAGLCVLSPYFSYVIRVVTPAPAPRLMRNRFVRRASRTLGSLGDGLAATLVAQAVTSPLTVPVFGELSVVAPLANVVLGPLFTAVISTGIVAVALCAIPGVGLVLARGPLALSLLAARVAIAALQPLSRLPLANVPVQGMVVPVALSVLVVAVYLVWPQVRRRHLVLGLGTSAAVLALALGRWRLLAPARVVVLDVGQGDAVLVQEAGVAILVDTGPDGSVVEALAREHVFHLDAVILTHLHEDHVGGVDDLAGSVPCDQVLVARGVAGHMGEGLATAVEDLTGQKAKELSYGDVLGVGGFSLRVVSPTGEVSGEENADSLELALSYEQGGRSLTALLTGDAEREETGEVLARGDVGDVDLLKVGHHGSAVSLTQEEACALDPEVAVASAGEGNRYGHPTEECVGVLEGAGARFLCTKDAGDVDVRPGRRGPVVRYDGQRGS